MHLLDCHSHWSTKKGYIFRTERELAQQVKVWGTTPEYQTEDEMAAYFRKNNARVILDLAWTKFLPIPEMRVYNDYAFDVQRRHPDVIFGHWLIFDPRKGMEAVDEFVRCRSVAPGFVGIAVSGQGVGVPASDPLWNPFYEASIAANLPVMIMTGLTGIGQGLPGGNGLVLDHGHPRYIDEVAARFPDLRILAARPAYPWQDEMIAVLLHKANVSYELHGWSPKKFSPALKEEIRGRLQDRVMFGCDFPVLRYEKVVARYREEGYGEDLLGKILHRNAEAYFNAAEVEKRIRGT
jgi:predicted TIM-barrel fold metal-dependent hydrolase